MITKGLHTYCPKEDIDCYQYVNLTFGKYCSIGSGLKIYSGNHAVIEHPKVVSSYPFKEMFNWDYPKGKNDGVVTVGNDVWIATDVSIIEGVTIGDGVLIGARANVTRDVPPYAFVAGNPARIKRFRFKPEQIMALERIRWWDWPDDKVKEAMQYMDDIESFLRRYEK